MIRHKKHDKHNYCKERLICKRRYVKTMYITDVKACVDRLACETMNKRHTNVKLEEVKLAKTEQ